jgi:hypothetical protein
MFSHSTPIMASELGDWMTTPSYGDEGANLAKPKTTLSPYDQRIVDIFSEIYQDLYYMQHFVAAFGIPGNILLFLIMIQKRNRSTPTGLYMAALSVVDAVALLGSIHLLREMSKAGLIDPAVACGNSFINNISTSCSCWIIVAMTVDRFIAVQWPLKAKELCTKKRAKWSVVGMCTFCLAFNFHFIFTQAYVCNPISKKCKCTQYAYGLAFLISIIQWGDFIVNAYCSLF